MLKSFNQIFILIVISLLSIVYIHNSTAENQLNQKSTKRYKDIFYPKGMPVRENVFTGKSIETIYSFYDEVSIPHSDLLLVLYSEKVPNEGSDEIYTVYLGTVFKKREALKVLEKMDLTGYIPVYVEFPGNYYRMDGRLNLIPFSENASGVHVNLWAALTGTGSVSGASDLFFKVGKRSTLELVLELKETSQYSRLSFDEFRAKNTDIFLVNVNVGKVNKIILQEQEITKKGDKIDAKKKDPVEYEFIDGRFQHLKGLEKSKLAIQLAQATRLIRSKSICFTTDYCERMPMDNKTPKN